MDSRSTGPEGWPRNLAFVYWHREPDVPVIVAGGTILPPLVYWIDQDDPDFGDVGSATGPVTYRLYAARPQPGLPPPAGRVLLVQLMTDTRLIVEVFPEGMQPVGFTPNAVAYLR
jgi:hypothetical protein